MSMRFFVIISNLNARVAELVDALVLGTSVFDVRVRVSPFAPIFSLSLIRGPLNSLKFYLPR